MLRSKIIRQIGALLLLLLFIESNTPRQVLHDLFANHIDSKKVTTTVTNSTQVAQLSYHCQCDHIVAESPYIHYDQPLSTCLSFVHPTFPVSNYSYVTDNKTFQLVLRGPPAV